MSVPVFSLFDLREVAEWDTGLLIASGFQWPVAFDAPKRLGDVAFRLEPQHFASVGTQIVTPRGLDHLYGGIRRRESSYQGAAYLVGGKESNLQRGDLLIAGRTGAPALMVQDHLLASTVSSSFSAYRFDDMNDAYWVWGVLNSSSGQAYLRSAFTESLSGRRLRVNDLDIPWADRGRRAVHSQAIAAIESTTHRQCEEAVETWWSTTDLRDVEWRLALATPDPDQLLGGTSLVDHGIEIHQGRSLDRAANLAVPTDDAIPVVSGAVLSGRPVTAWVLDEDRLLVAEPGDVLVASVGERANARVVEQRAVVGSGLFRLRVPGNLRPESVASFFNGQIGHGLRNMAITGTTIPRVSLKDFRELKVPDGTLGADMSGGPLLPLAEQLERVLWSS